MYMIYTKGYPPRQNLQCKCLCKLNIVVHNAVKSHEVNTILSQLATWLGSELTDLLAAAFSFFLIFTSSTFGILHND